MIDRIIQAWTVERMNRSRLDDLLVTVSSVVTVVAVLFVLSVGWIIGRKLGWIRG